MDAQPRGSCPAACRKTLEDRKEMQFDLPNHRFSLQPRGAHSNKYYEPFVQECQSPRASDRRAHFA